MKLWLRLLAFRFRVHCDQSKHPLDVIRVSFRVWPTDLDVFRHMNNGVYLTILDLGRLALMTETGMLQQLNKRGWYAVVVAETITFRKSLKLWQRFVVETRVMGVDEQALYLEQRFVVGSELAARAVIRGRFLVKGGGLVTPDQVLALLELTPEHAPALPSWVTTWAAATSLPPNRESTPSIWP